MKELLIIVVPAMLFIVMAELHSTYKFGEFGEKVYINKDKLFFGITATCMAVFAGLRVEYNDTFAYRYAYEMLGENTFSLASIDWNLGSNPGFQCVNGLIHMAGWSTQDFIMLYSVITIGIYIWFIRKYTENMSLSMFLFITMGCYTFSMAAIKQTVAVAFCLVATDRIIKKKKIAFVFWVVIASLFHPYSLMYLVVPFLSFSPWTKKSYLMLFFFGIVGIGLEAVLGTMVTITSMMGEEYTTTALTGDGVNIFRVAVVWVPVFLSFMARKVTKKNNDRVSNIIMNLATLNAEIMFIGMFGTANYFARLANYFLIFQAIALPWIFKFYNIKSKKILINGAVIGYLVYFIYAEAVMYGGFDFLFQRLTLLEYVSTLI